MMLDILESIIVKITGENKKTINSLAPTETYASIILDKCGEEKIIIEAFHDNMEAMLDKGPKEGSIEHQIMYEEVDKKGETLYSVYGWSNDRIKELQIIITWEWMTRRFGGKKNFEKIMADYLIRVRYSYP